jgi:hypothetical protein
VLSGSKYFCFFGNSIIGRIALLKVVGVVSEP